MDQQTDTQTGVDATQTEGEENQATEGKQIDYTELNERYYKTIGENKKYRTRLQAQQAELEELRVNLQKAEQEKLRSQGKYKELYETERSQREEIEKARQKERSAFAYRSVASQVASELAKAGCVDTEAALRLADIDAIEVDENFNIDTGSVKSLLETMQKERSYLFRRAAPTVRDGVPTKGANGFQKQPTDFNKLSREDLMELAKQMDRR